VNAIYDTIGVDYANLRRPDPRIAAQIEAALGSARSVLNVGAGTGSYEPPEREVTAVEPSLEMIRQRPPGSAPVVQASAESLPFEDGAFDAAMAILTIHHWPDRARGLAEVRRVTRGPIVILTFDPAHRGNWLTDYFPELVGLDDRVMPAMGDYARWLGPVEVAPVPVPHDCRDGFMFAYWRRPHAYLDPRIRAAISAFWSIDGVGAGVARLARDIETGLWAERHGDLLDLTEWDAGYRLVVA
jgi:SAM-dependent methyltransferase